MQQSAGDDGEPGASLGALIVGSLLVGLFAGLGFSNQGPWAPPRPPPPPGNPVRTMVVEPGADRIEVELTGDPAPALAVEVVSMGPEPAGTGTVLARMETERAALRKARILGLPPGAKVVVRVTTERDGKRLVVAGERVELPLLASLRGLRVVDDPGDPWVSRIEAEIEPVAPLAVTLVEAYGRHTELRTAEVPTGALSRALPVLSPGSGHRLVLRAAGHEVRPAEVGLEMPSLAPEEARPGLGPAADWALGLAGLVGRLDETRLRFVPFEGPSRGWTRDVPEGADGVPAMLLDRVVVRSQEGELMGLDATSGATVYRQDDLGPLTRDPLALPPGRVLAVSERSRLGGVAAAAFDAARGHLVWPAVEKLPIAAPLAFDPVVGARAIALVGGEGKVLLLDPGSGRVRPPLATPAGGPSAAPAMDPTGDRVALGGRAGGVFVYDGLERAGPPRLVYRAELGGGPVLGLAFEDGGELLAVVEGFVVCVASDGRPAWRTALPGPPAGPPLAHGGRVFVPLVGGGYGVVRQTDGDWLERVPGPGSARPRFLATSPELYLVEPGHPLRVIRRGPRPSLHTNSADPGGSS